MNLISPLIFRQVALITRSVELSRSPFRRNRLWRRTTRDWALWETKRTKRNIGFCEFSQIFVIIENTWWAIGILHPQIFDALPVSPHFGSFISARHEKSKTRRNARVCRRASGDYYGRCRHFDGLIKIGENAIWVFQCSFV